MATINKNRIREKHVKPCCSEAVDNGKFYGSIAWKRLRDIYYKEHCTCHECLQHFRITPAEAIHHLRPWATGATEEEQWELLLDEDNLRALCNDCHYAYHNKMRRYNLSWCGGLTDKEWAEAHGMK